MLVSDLEFVIDKIQSGAVCVLPTDTVYGLVATTGSPEVVERIYMMKGRPYDKPFIILLSELSQLDGFDIKINDEQADSLAQLWPGPVSVILPCSDDAFAYLHRGKQSLAFRIPKLVWLQELIHKTGPVIATSANRSGFELSSDMNQIMRQLPKADLFIEGPVSSTPSRLVRLRVDGTVEELKRT